ncbi:hypothetical protein ACN20G_19045 [Streptomyces sp. BI20]|uniref:hypothetical protein n=1 Tax=Streptomyces sp. BI20 TaxID=3403460 RepID=UPI003C734FC1
MALTVEERRYLAEFRAEVDSALGGVLSEYGGVLRGFSLSEESDGVWAVATVEFSARPEPWVRRSLILPASGPDKAGWLAGAVFCTAIAEDLHLGRDSPAG